MEGFDAVKSFREGNSLAGCRSCQGEGLLYRNSQVQRQRRCRVTVWWLCTRDCPHLGACEMLQPGLEDSKVMHVCIIFVYRE